MGISLEGMGAPRRGAAPCSNSPALSKRPPGVSSRAELRVAPSPVGAGERRGVAGSRVQDIATAGQRTFPVVERFTSINGEGTHAGRLAAFVRFRGCDLACSYCDTTWANVPDAPAEPMTVDDILAFVDASPACCVTLTGGEPLLQEGIGELIAALVAEEGRYVEIETNGAVPLAVFTRLRERLVGDAPNRLSFTMDCKLPSSGMARRMVAGNYEVLDMRDTVKFVIGGEGDFPAVLDVMRRHQLQERCQVYLSPVFGQMDPARIVEFMQENRLDEATLQLQLHKIVWPGEERGV